MCVFVGEVGAANINNDFRVRQNFATNNMMTLGGGNSISFFCIKGLFSCMNRDVILCVCGRELVLAHNLLQT